MKELSNVSIGSDLDFDLVTLFFKDNSKISVSVPKRDPSKPDGYVTGCTVIEALEAQLGVTLIGTDPVIRAINNALSIGLAYHADALVRNVPKHTPKKIRANSFASLEALCSGKRIACERRGKKIELTTPDGGTTAECASLAEAWDTYRNDGAFCHLPIQLRKIAYPLFVRFTRPMTADKEAAQEN